MSKLMRFTVLAATLAFSSTGLADDVVVVDAPAAVAESTYGPGKVEAGMFLGGFINNYYHQFYDEDQRPNMPRDFNRVAPVFGLRLGVYGRYVGLEAEGSMVAAALRDDNNGVQIAGLTGQVVFQVPARVTPFLALGVGLRHTETESMGDDDDAPIHAGVGLRMWLSQSVAFRVDGRFLRGPSYPYEDGVTLNASYGEFMFGISFKPGTKKEAVVVVVPPPDPDPDRDGIAGMDDECPQEAGPAPNGCPSRDKDGDGIVDESDKCPAEAETVNTFEDTDGCPDVIPDTDGDGFNDQVDKCKDQPEDKDNFEDEDGCPDPDNDGDGVLDAKDKCVDQSGPVENAGCPDTDGDGDGVVDRLDNCPTEKGTEKNQGCKAKQLVVITKDQLKILDQVKFVTNSAKLSPASNKLLDNIAKVLVAHPEITKIKIEGHTDDVGDDAKNLQLSQDRAQSVVAYLTKKGVDAGRMEPIGHGETKPLEDNKTKKGKAANRRVEFNIVTE